MALTHIVYLALGTNLGDRQTNLQQALEALPPEIEVAAVSRLYETEPAYVLEQPTFFNIAIKGRTKLAPVDLLSYLKELEKKVGRRESRRYGPRVIDIDIIFYDNLILDLPQLQIPHPRLSERGFVLCPLADIAAELMHPGSKQTVADLVDQLSPDYGILNVSDW